MQETIPEKMFPWFALTSVPRVGNILFKKLIDRFSTPERVFAASIEQLREIDGISGNLASSIKTHRCGDGVKKEIDRAVEKGFRIVTFRDDEYPRLLRRIPDPPPYL